MKREDLTKLGLTDETVVDGIMKLHGLDIEAHKARITTLQSQYDTAAAQLTEAGNTIEGFKAMKPDELKAAADDYKIKYEQAQTESTAKLLQIKQDHALERELRETYKVADLVAVKAHLKSEALKFNEADESFVGLKEQIEPLKEKHGSYFSDTTPPPVITAGGNHTSVLGDKMVDAMRAAARLPAVK